jgi:CBS domain-containing protein
MIEIFEGPVAGYASYGIECVDVATPLQEVARILELRGFSGLGVREGAGPVIGIVSTTDVLAAVELETRDDRRRFAIRPAARTAGEVMRTPVRVDEGATLREAARRMSAHRIQRVFVARDDETVGVLSARDLLRAVANARVMAPVSTVMTPSIEMIDLGASVRDAIGRLVESNVHGLVVCDGTAPIGLFTHTEALCARALPQALLDNPVERVMSYEYVVVDAATPLHRVAAQSVAMQLRRVLVTDGHTLCGIATALDLARHIGNSASNGAEPAAAS